MALAASRFMNHIGPMLPRNLRRVVGAGVVDHEDACRGKDAAKIVDDFAHGLGLVEARNANGERCGHGCIFVARPRADEGAREVDSSAAGFASLPSLWATAWKPPVILLQKRAIPMVA